MIRKVFSLGGCFLFGAACALPVEPEPAPAGVEPAGVEPAGDEPAGVEPAGVEPAGVEPAEVELAAEALEAEADLAMTPQSWPWNPPSPVCQPGAQLHPCYQWSSGCYESPECGVGCKTYQTEVCNQYRMSRDGRYYYYRADCTVLVTCNGAPQGQGCVQTCT